MDFDTIEALQKHIENSVESVLRLNVSQMATDVVKGELDEKLYNRPPSEYYDRTYELKNSVISVFDDKFSRASKNNIRIEIKHDTSRTFMPMGHRSWVNNSIQNRNIPGWINDGFQGVLPSPFIGINYFESSFLKIESKLKPTMIKGLKRYNIQAS